MTKRFSGERQKRGEKPVCVEVDECAERTADCEQLCINLPPGSFSCACNEGFFIRGDNKTCEKKPEPNIQDYLPDKVEVQENKPVSADEHVAAATTCYASRDTVLRLHDKVRSNSKA